MRAIGVVVLGLLAIASGHYMTHDVKYADKEFLIKQKAIFEVFQHVHQHEVHTHLWEDAKTYKFEEHFDCYTNVDAVKHFYEMYKHGMLPLDEVFTPMNSELRHEAISLFHFFYYAKDWDTFYKSMVWARFHMNEGMFVYALTMACYHRADMVGIVLPAPYEIYPYYFFNSEVIAHAQMYKMQGFYGMKKVDDVYTVVIPSNYTGWYVHTNTDQKVSYYTEDIGLNSYYYNYHMDYPFWMGGKEFNLYKDRRGEFYLYAHSQSLARYYMERLSNDLGVIPDFTWWKPIKTGYYPNMRYYNGAPFPSRDNYHHIDTAETHTEMKYIIDWERRIRDAIDLGFVMMPDGTHMDLTKPESVEILGNLIQSNADSVNQRYYGNIWMYASWLLGASVEHFDDFKLIPGVMEHFETAMRDPMWYQFQKKIMSYYWQFLDHLPVYKVEEYNFPGVKIESVEIEKLVTYFDKFDADITNAVDVEVFDEKSKMSEMKKFGKIAHYQGEDFVIKARTSRLNHLPFTMKLNVMTDKAYKAVVKVFMGPKYDQYGNVYGINENRENFYELDSWFVDLVAGKNVITHSSNDFSWYVKDRTTYFELYKLVMKATTGDYKFPLDMSEAHCGIPNRLMLPKGKKGGMPFQFYFIVVPFHEPKVTQFTGFDKIVSCGVGSGARYLDTLPFGFPFNRMIDEAHWFTSNMMYHDVMVYHKSEVDVNVTH